MLPSTCYPTHAIQHMVAGGRGARYDYRLMFPTAELSREPMPRQGSRAVTTDSCSRQPAVPVRAAYPPWPTVRTFTDLYQTLLSKLSNSLPLHGSCSGAPVLLAPDAGAILPCYRTSSLLGHTGTLCFSRILLLCTSAGILKGNQRRLYCRDRVQRSWQRTSAHEQPCGRQHQTHKRGGVVGM